MGILDAFKQDCIDNPNVTNGDSALQEEINKQLKAIADYDANPETLDSQIKFNPEEFDFNEKKISKELYNEEDSQYPEADDPEELLKQCECKVEEVKVGDTVRVYDKGFFSFITGKVTKIVKVYEPENFNPVAVVIIKYQVENAVNCLMEEERALTNKTFDDYYAYNMYTKKEIKHFTLKNENQ